MEDKNKKEPNVKVYVEGGCTFIIKREFEKGGTTILEQMLSLLLDIMEKKELDLNDKA